MKVHFYKHLGVWWCVTFDRYETTKQACANTWQGAWARFKEKHKEGV